MDINFNFFNDLTYITVSGEYNIHDDTSILEQIAKNKKLNKHIPIMIDCTNVDFSKITFETIQMATHHDIKQQKMDEYKIAIFTNSGFNYDIVKQWYGSESKNKGYNTEVFSCIESAKEWLKS